MSATEELRRMLDERGVEWHEATPHKTKWFSPVLNGPVAVSEWRGKLVLDAGYVNVTPEQALAATLGAGECEMDVLDTGNEAAYEHYEYIMHCANCHHEFGYVQYNEDGDTWQDEKPAFCPNCGRSVRR